MSYCCVVFKKLLNFFNFLRFFILKMWTIKSLSILRIKFKGQKVDSIKKGDIDIYYSDH